LREAALQAGREADAVNVAGYLLTHVDKSRREALNRAKREPFVIYMMSVLSDFSINQAGFEVELRNKISAFWRAEDYHSAAQLIPDDMLDAFMLVGTHEEVAEGAQRFHEAGMNLPLLQPVLQEEDQVKQVLESAAIYGTSASALAEVPSSATRPISITTSGSISDAARSRLADDRLTVFERGWRRISAYYEIARPFSLSASSVPVIAVGALAWIDGRFDLLMFIAALLGIVCLHIGTNIVNEIYDVRNGVDAITSPRASQAILKGRLTEREAFSLVVTFFAISTFIGIYLIITRGLPIVLLGVLGLIAGYSYTAPPLEYKYRAVGLPLVFLMFGPLTTLGAYYTITGTLTWQALVVSLPVGLLVTAILHGNEWRDIADDKRYGIGTLSAWMGNRRAYLLYVSLIVGAYLALTIAVLLDWLPTTTLLAMLSLPLFVRAIKNAELGVMGQQRAIAMIDLQTAQLQALFGLLFIAGLVWSALSAIPR
jgi:1,4-dihydroxy-2-naphthoate octaprenyltransferase